MTQITLFLLALACSPLTLEPQGDHMTVFSCFSNMDLIELQSFSILKQQIVWRLHWESERLNQSVLSQGVINATV